MSDIDFLVVFTSLHSKMALLASQAMPWPGLLSVSRWLRSEDLLI